jgi:hypothetical protein
MLMWKGLNCTDQGFLVMMIRGTCLVASFCLAQVVTMHCIVCVIVFISETNNVVGQVPSELG